MGGSPVRWSSEPPRPPDRVPPDWVRGRLDAVETDLADVTARALALVGDAVAAQVRLRSEVVRLVVAGLLATVVVTAGLCVATLVLLL